MQDHAYISFSSKPKPTSVKVITQYPNEFKEVPIAELERECGFQWIEGYSALKDLIRGYENSNKIQIDQVLANALKEALVNPYRQNLALYKVDDQMGYVVVYIGNDPIPQNMYLSFYAGEICDIDVRGHGAYASAGNDPTNYTTPEDRRYAKKSSCIDAETVGNITRFMADLLGPSEMDKYEFSPGFSKDSVMTANLDPGAAVMNGLPVKLFKTSRVIHKGDIVGYRYSEADEFWFMRELDGISRKLFSTKGQVLNFGYRRSVIGIHLEMDGVKEYAPFSVQNIYLAQTLKQDLLVRHRKTGIIMQATPQEIEDALERNGYSPQAALGSDDIVRGKLVSNTQQRILASCVNASFKCYLRNDNSYLVDAFLSTADQNESVQVAKQLGAVGLFPRVTSNNVVIDAVNTRPVGNAISRLRR